MIKSKWCSRWRGSNLAGLLLQVVLHLLTLLVIGGLGVKDIPISHIVALVGEPTYLPCDISTSHEGDSVHLVLWYREDLEASVYSVDVRDRDFVYAERWSDNTVFANRAYFIPNKTPARLGVEHIQEQDAGIYRCRVDFQIGQTRNSKVNLTVIVPPNRIVILDENEVVPGSEVGPYNEGETLRLFCDVYGGKPPPTVEWYRNNRFLENETTIVNQGVTRSTVVIQNLGRNDVNSELTCNATNYNKSSPLSSSVRINMYFDPLDVKIVGENQPLSADKTYNIKCVTSGSRPSASITWWRDGQRLVDSTETVTHDGNTTTSILHFKATKDDAGKRLFCRAMNPSGVGANAIEDEWLLGIQYVPEMKIQLGKLLNPNNIREGTDVYFDCLIKAEPMVDKVEWHHQGNVLHHSITQGIIISNQSLVLQRVGRKNSGNYTCVGYNKEGKGDSSVFYLNVMFSPTCKPNQTKVHGVAKQEKANISCKVEANPPEVQFRWTFNNSAENINVDSANIISRGTASAVSYTPQTELDYGTLLCWAMNIIGNQQTPCIYHIIPAGRPDMVHNCTISNTSTSSFYVRCMEGFNGGLPQTFLLEVRESNSHALQANMTSVFPQFSVSHLQSSSLYQAYIYAYNDKGRSEVMVLQGGTLKVPEKQLTANSERPRQPLRLTPMLSVMIGVVAALVIVAAIVIIVLKIQTTHGMDEHGKPHMLESDKIVKEIPIQRELRFREGSCLLQGEKHNSDGQFRGKIDMSADLSESDEKNPDIIPQLITGDEPLEFLRKRRLVSTIDTSPSRKQMDHTNMSSVGDHANFVGYCTIRNGIPLRELSNLSSKQKTSMVSEMYESGVCTLPRQHWTSPAGVQSMTMKMSPPIIYGGMGLVDRGCRGHSPLVPQESMESTTTARTRGGGQCCLKQQGCQMMSGSTSLIVTKRESSV